MMCLHNAERKVPVTAGFKLLDRCLPRLIGYHVDGLTNLNEMPCPPRSAQKGATPHGPATGDTFRRLATAAKFFL